MSLPPGIAKVLAAAAAQRSLAPTDGHEWGPDQPVPPAAAARSPEWRVLGRIADNRQEAMKAAQQIFLDACSAYTQSVADMQKWRAEVMDLIVAARPDLKTECIQWDPDTNMLRVATKHDHPVKPKPVDARPEWAKKLAEDLNSGAIKPE